MPRSRASLVAVVVYTLAAACSEDDGGPASAAGTAGSAGRGATGGGSGSSAGGTSGAGGISGAGGASGSGGAGSAGTAGTGDGSVGTGGSAGSGGSAGTTPDAGTDCTLAASGAIRVERDNQVVELLRIESTSGPAIQVDGHTGVVIRNVAIRHAGGPGIEFSNADDLRIENVSIEYTAAPATGQNPSSDLNNISGYSSARPTIINVRLTRGSSGIYLVESPDSKLTFIEGHDFRGPFPRGQLVQWDKSSNGSLEEFSVINPATSWPEDNVNIYQSTNVNVRRGFIDGNNSPSGVGVIFDGGPSTGLVEDVDAVHMGNGCFSDYDGGEGIIFRRTRCRDNICGSQGRGAPSSNALMWCGHPDRTTLRIEQSTYFAACNPGNVVWPRESFAQIELTEGDFTPRSPISVDLCWE
jgi:hypothetical protein